MTQYPTPDRLPTTAYDRLVDALRAHGSKITHPRAGQAQAQCPAHDDRNPSLSITRIQGQVLVHCHAGCNVGDVLAALTLTAKDLFDEPRGATYQYTNLDGAVLRTVTRTPDKKFWQGGETKGTSTLYRLPEVTVAVRQEAAVYVCEGEKDVHALESVGAIATTAPMGASNWHKVDATPLWGGKIRVIVDRDDAGRKWGRAVRDSLDGMVQSLTFLTARTGHDAADHIAAGHTLEEFRPLPEDEDPPEPSTAETVAASAAGVVTLSDVTPERVTYLWAGRLPAGKLVVVDGDPSVGKSTLMLDMSAHLSTGAAWPDGAAGTGPTNVLLMSAEDGLADTIAPRLVAAGADRTRIHAVLDVEILDGDGNPRMVPPSLPRDIGRLEFLVRHYAARLVVVDVLMAFLSNGVDSHRDQDVRGVLHQLAAMAERTGCTVILIRHLNKAGGSNALYRGGGSIGIVGAARAAFLVARDPEDDDRRILATTKMNLAAEPPSLAYRLVSDAATGSVRVEWETEPVDHTAASLLRTDDSEPSERSEAVDWLLGFLRESGGSAPARDVFKAARADGISERTLQRARAKAGVNSERRGFASGSVWFLEASLAPFMPAKSADANCANGVANVSSITTIHPNNP